MDRVASAVGMKLGLRKCGVAHMQKVLPGPENPSTEDGIKCLFGKDTYWYPGVEQLFATDDKKVKDSVIAEYKKRLHKIGKSQLNSRHKVDATNTLAISLLRYRFVTVKWTRRELRDLDVLTWKVLRRYQSHHLNLGAGGGEPSSLPHDHLRSNHGCGVQAPTAVGGKELL